MLERMPVGNLLGMGGSLMQETTEKCVLQKLIYLNEVWVGSSTEHSVTTSSRTQM